MENTSESTKDYNKNKKNRSRDKIREDNYVLMKNANKKSYNNSKPKVIKLRNRNSNEFISNTQLGKSHTKNNSMIYSKSKDKSKKKYLNNKKDIKTEYTLCQKEMKSLMNKEEELKLLREQLRLNFGKVNTNKNIEISKTTMKTQKKSNKPDDNSTIKKYRKNLSMIVGENEIMNNKKKHHYHSKSKDKINNTINPNNINKKNINNLKNKNRKNLCLFESNNKNNITLNPERKINDESNKKANKYSLSFKGKKKNLISLNKYQFPSSARNNILNKKSQNLNKSSLINYKNRNNNNTFSLKTFTSIKKDKPNTNKNSFKSKEKSKKKSVLNDCIKNINLQNEKKNLSEKIKIRSINNIGIITKAGEEEDGVEKINQDNYFDYDLSHGYKFIGVCDGHGEDGQNVSEYLRNVLPVELNKELNKAVSSENKRLSILESILEKNRNELIDYDKNNDDNKKEKDEKVYLIENLEKLEKIKQLFIKVFTSTNLKLIEENYMFNLENSGSTCISVFLQKTKINKMYIANVGDSRAIIIKDPNTKNEDNNNILSYEQLSRDHTASEKDEAERILKHGGEIQQIQNENGEWEGPLRIYMKDDEGPGLAMTRSFGDVIGSVLGVIAEPEVTEYIIKKEDKAIIIASDGLWEYVSNEEVANIVQKLIIKNDANIIVNELYKISYETWKQKDTGIDDITIICILLN